LLPGVRLESPPPRVFSAPPAVSSSGEEAVELAASAGLFLDEGQQLVLRHGLGEKPGGKWAAFEVGVMESRQNGKGAIIEARELAGLFLLGERMIVHTAHLFDTALEAFRRILELIESTPDLDSRVKRVSRSHGEEGVELLTGQRLKFKARTKGGGRGFSGDCVILDEAMILPEPAMRALMFTLSARPNPQLWYLGSAVDRQEHDHGQTFSRLRHRGLRGDDPSLVWAEWSAGEIGDVVDVDDPVVWAAANPGVAAGRIELEHVAKERRTMSARGFCVERLGMGDWYPEHEEDGLPAALDERAWKAAGDPAAERGAEPVFGVCVAPDHSWAAIAVGWRRPDGRVHVQVSRDGVAADYRPGTAWLRRRVGELRRRWGADVLVDHAAKGFVDDATNTTEEQRAQADNALADALAGDELRHGNQPELNTAAKGASWRQRAHTRVLDAKGSTDISPLRAAALVVWQLRRSDVVSRYEDRGFVTL
jgi:hypothetical protein